MKCNKKLFWHAFPSCCPSHTGRVTHQDKAVAIARGPAGSEPPRQEPGKTDPAHPAPSWASPRRPRQSTHGRGVASVETRHLHSPAAFRALCKAAHGSSKHMTGMDPVQGTHKLGVIPMSLQKEWEKLGETGSNCDHPWISGALAPATWYRC